MKFGICASLEHAKDVAEIGFDYIEPTVVGTVDPLNPGSDDTILTAANEQLSGSGILPEAFNVFLPGDLKITADSYDPVRQESYLKVAIRRVALLGGTVIVFGSGGARMVPEGVSHQTAVERTAAFLTIASGIAEQHGVTVVIEPLNRGECNFINTVGEGMEIVRLLNHRNIQVLSDLYHVSTDGQSYDETRDAGQALKHVHIAGGENRRIPIPADLDFLTGYFSVLKSIGYDHRISIEANSANLLSEAQVGLDVMRNAWTRA